MSKLELVIVRHGQTVANATGYIQGQTDVPLDETGRKQAQLAAKALQDEKFDFVYSSDLSRASVTAKTITPDMEVILTPALREWHLGVWQGMSVAKIKELYPEDYEAFAKLDPERRIPGGETRNEMLVRVKKFIMQLPEKHPDGGKILLVSHGGAIRVMFQILMGENNVFPQPPIVGNTSIGRFTWINGSWQMVSWNETGHLKAIGLVDGGY